jgi:predicted TPR repeat methyltransferase
MRSSRRVTLGAAVIAGLVLTVAADGLAQVSRVSGTVKDERGDPIPGATIVAENERSWPTRYTAVADAKGRYGLLGLRSGTWVFTVSAPGFVAVSGTAYVRGFGNTPPLDFRLARVVEPPLGPLGRVDLDALQADLDAAESLLAAGKHLEAAARYEAVLERVPTLTSVNIQVGRAYRAAGRLPDALAAFERAATGTPPLERAIAEAALTELEMGRPDAAHARLAPGADRPDASREVLYACGEVSSARGDREAAIACYERAVVADPTWALPHFRLGVMAAERGDTRNAAQHLEQVIAFDPESPQAAEAEALLRRIRN